ncbi:hypothetical protein WOLCODRAFT_130795 [Wolfiporia cocos MD-104 SS10]|uniref:Nucleolar protein 16 n=1 Tax=Wolfiporia cocos (strain MD-104) TaxID=742152 RepID=A0A2H3J7Q5_WOLCO|nr:hypothetical protein WOLCODRAFT_130795 [Wolfiporia cocos MD-104 SS10]
MANPRQRRKQRSGSYKPVQHSRHAQKNLKKQPPIRGPKVLQEAWDRKKTVRQNYAALGLAASLNPTQSGGAEPAQAESRAAAPAQTQGAEPAAGAPVPRGFGRIVRDADGNVVGVELPDEEEARRAPATAEDVPDVRADAQLAAWVAPRAGGAALEEMSRAGGRRVARHASAGERAVLRRLVARHGEDVAAMARDRRLNADQRTAGELRRAIRRAGGAAAAGAT